MTSSAEVMRGSCFTHQVEGNQSCAWKKENKGLFPADFDDVCLTFQHLTIAPDYGQMSRGNVFIITIMTFGSYQNLDISLVTFCTPDSPDQSTLVKVRGCYQVLCSPQIQSQIHLSLLQPSVTLSHISLTTFSFFFLFPPSKQHETNQRASNFIVQWYL